MVDSVIIQLIHEFIQEESSSSYDDIMNLIRSYCTEKNYEIEGYYHSNWCIATQDPLIFDETYFTDPDRRNLFILLLALQHSDIYNYLQLIWPYFYEEEEELSLNILHREIYLLEESGVSF